MEATGCYGNTEVRTPNLDRLASIGTKYQHCWSSSPVCSPYRCSLQTGLYQHQHGMHHNDLYLDQRLPSLADWMHLADYRTHYIGKSHWWGPDRPGHVERDGQMRWGTFQGHNRGHFHFDAPDFDEQGKLTHRYQGQYDADVYTDLAISHMTDSDSPWCIQLNLGQPHTQTMVDDLKDPQVIARLNQLNQSLHLNIPEQASESNFPQAMIGPLVPEKYLQMYDPASLSLPSNVRPEDENKARWMLREYYAMITSIDDQIGRLLDHLHATDQFKNTLVIYTSDHGDFVGSHGQPRNKAKPYQVAARVPLIIAGAGCLSGVTIESPVSSVDLLPTLIDVSGKLPEQTGGPWTYQPQTTSERDRAVCDQPMATDGIYLRGLSFRKTFEKAKDETQPDILLSLGGWRALFDGRYLYAVRREADGQVRPWHLIDTQNDPHDLHDLSQSEPNRVATMQQRLAARLAAENDTFLHSA